MRKLSMKIPFIALFAAALIPVILLNCSAQESDAVRMEFDARSERIDLKTGEKLPPYRFAQPGSFRFYQNRLDKPETFIYYFHDGRRSVEISELGSMKKDQGRFAIWNLVWRTGRGLHPAYGPRIHHFAVSFIPLDTATKKPGGRVFVLLRDLRSIVWTDVADKQQ